MIQTGFCYFLLDDDLHIAKSYLFGGGEVRTAWIKIITSPYDDDREPLESEWLT